MFSSAPIQTSNKSVSYCQWLTNLISENQLTQLIKGQIIKNEPEPPQPDLFELLPNEIKIKVFSYLDIESLRTLRLTCLCFKLIMSDPIFLKSVNLHPFEVAIWHHSPNYLSTDKRLIDLNPDNYMTFGDSTLQGKFIFTKYISQWPDRNTREGRCQGKLIFSRKSKEDRIQQENPGAVCFTGKELVSIGFQPNPKSLLPNGWEGKQESREYFFRLITGQPCGGKLARRGESYTTFKDQDGTEVPVITLDTNNHAMTRIRKMISRLGY